MRKSYLSFSATVILQAVDHGYQYGFDIMNVTGLPSGTVYPALRRLEDAGLVASRWERHQIAQREMRPPRKYYEMTADGHDALADAVKRYRLLEKPRAHARAARRSDDGTQIRVSVRRRRARPLRAATSTDRASG